jgi:hypothetical protein
VKKTSGRGIMLKKSFIRLTILLFLISIQGLAQAPNTEILKTYIDIKKVNSNTVSEVVTNISQIYSIPIGVELIHLETRKPLKKKNLLKKSGSLKVILDQLILARKEYNWIDEKGSIFVFPDKNDSEITDFLSYRFDDRKFDFDDDRVDVCRFVFDVPGVIERLKRLGLQPFPIRNYFSGLTYVDPIDLERSGEIENIVLSNSVEVKNLTVKELLYKLQKEGKIRAWYVARWGNNREFVSLVTL